MGCPSVTPFRNYESLKFRRKTVKLHSYRCNADSNVGSS